MSALPEWLWPMEDEEAVQEAERLIEETHNALRRMEAGMKDQRMSGQHLSEAAEKLKSEVNRKMHALEKELKSISEPTSVDPQPHKKGSANEHHKLKPVSTSEEGYCRQHPNLNASTSQSKSNPKLNDHITAQQQAQNISISHPLPKQWKNVDPKWNSSTAEQVVLTARAKVQDALAVARNVTASLDHHAIESSVHSKPMPKLQARNVGIFEVKSHSDRKIVAPKRRLGQTLLPSISIKRGLEKQSIPSIQVLPGEKTTLSNVFVCNMKHDDHVEGGGDCQNKITLKESAKCSVQHQSANTTTSKINDDEESAVVQLSRQLAEVEELREVNQAQVNHVLRFLLSRVCNSSPTQRATRSPTDSQNKVCDQQDKSHTTSSSDSSQCPIAYDSLSRFLETYKRAANQSMLARKRATVRRQKEVAKQKKEIEKAQTFAENHLLIGPLRQGTQVKGTDFNQSKLEPQDLMESYSTSSSSNKEVDLHENAEMDANSFKENGNESMTSKEMRDWNSPLQSMESGSKESMLLPVKSVGGVSVEDYEDDWEEEDNHNKSSNLDEGESLSDSILPPIIETEELASSVTRSENQKQSINSPKVEQKSSKLNTTQTIAIEKETAHQEGEKKEMHEEDSAPLFHTNLSLPLPSHLNGEQSIISVQTEQTDDRLNQGNIQIKPLYLSNSRSMSGERQDEGSETPVAGISQEKPPSTTSGSKVKQHQSTLRRSVVGHHSLCSSSSDAEMNNDSRPSRSSRRQDLSLREDLQLQSAILLNWQLEERLKKNSNETSVVKDQPNLPSLQTEVLTDIERRWQRTLDLLDQRLKMIEDNERIHRIANEIKLHSRLECTKPNNHEGEKHVPTEERNSIANTRSNSEVKVPTKDMMVQTSPEKNKFYFETKEFEPLLSSSMELLSNRPEPQNRKFVNSSWQKSLQPFEDLTAELLKYSNMGILPRLGHRERQNSKSSSSSTTSSNFQQSCAMVSFSDGELRNSASGSCSCSEGEYCVCGGRKLCSERAPPDGSQTLSDGENFMKDVSQGEIPSSKLRHLLKDTSFGEIAYHAQEVPAGDPYMAEESIESDDIDWELK